MFFFFVILSEFPPSLPFFQVKNTAHNTIISTLQDLAFASQTLILNSGGKIGVGRKRKNKKFGRVSNNNNMHVLKKGGNERVGENKRSVISCAGRSVRQINVLPLDIFLFP